MSDWHTRYAKSIHGWDVRPMPDDGRRYPSQPVSIPLLVAFVIVLASAILAGVFL